MKYPPRPVGRFTEFGTGLKLESIQKTSEIRVRHLGVEFFKPRDRAQNTQSSIVSIGSISRIEKQIAPEFTNLILHLLEKVPRFEYLYTCREHEREQLPVDLVQHPRARFLGWVDPDSAIDLFDIYLEPFPWGGGDMSLLAISRAIPYVALKTVESESVGVLSIMSGLTEGCEELGLCICEDFPSLVSRLSWLIEDPSARYTLGKKWQNMSQRMTQNSDVEWVQFLAG